jgi:hypothetical protein
MTDHLNGNGAPKGRAVPPLTEYIFANGAVAQLRPISQFTRAHIETQARRQHPAPKPPLNEVDYGDGRTVLEPNLADPDYALAMQEYQTTIGYAALEGMIELGVEIAIDAAKLARVADTLARLGMPLNERSDKIAYVKHCCMFDVAVEGPLLVGALQRAITPRPEDVDAHVAAFPGDVSRA